MSNIKKHIKSDKIKWTVMGILVAMLAIAVMAMAVALNREVTTKDIPGTAYEIGIIDETDGAAKDSELAIRTREYKDVDGLTVKVDNEAKIEYKLFFYDEDKAFISATNALTADFDGEIPENAKYFKIELTPTADEDGKVTLIEVLGYADLVTVTINR